MLSADGSRRLYRTLKSLKIPVGFLVCTDHIDLRATLVDHDGVPSWNFSNVTQVYLLGYFYRSNKEHVKLITCDARGMLGT